MKRIRLISSLIIMLLSFASATTVIPMSVEKLVGASSHVVEATAVQAWSEWNPQHTIIFTYTKFQVTRRLKGQAPTAIIVPRRRRSGRRRADRAHLRADPGGGLRRRRPLRAAGGRPRRRRG